MLRQVLRVAAVAGLAAASLAGWCFGSAQAMTRLQWEELLRERIKMQDGFAFSVFAVGLETPRLMQMTPDGDLLVSGYRDGSILRVRRDGDGDGRSDATDVLKSGLTLPHGLLLEGETLFLAEEHRVLRYRFDGVALSDERVVLDGLPDDGGHASRTLRRGPDGWLYLSIGSSCNVCIETNPWRATMLRFKEGEAPRIFAQGLRNTVGFDWQPQSAALFGVDNGRDQLGDDVPDDEVNAITEGGHYGWPYRHGSDVVDPDFGASLPAGLEPKPQFHGLGAHVAPLSIRFLRHQQDEGLNGSAIVAEHGSWNRSVKSGYRLVRLIFDGPAVREVPFMTGCETNDEVICRPVDIFEAPDGTLFLSDDYAGAIYRIAKSR